MGNPINPTSAINFNSRRTVFSFAKPPASAKLGAWRVGVLKFTFPLPPRPPFAAIKESPGFTRSYMGSPVSSSITTVPAGTLMIRSSPFFPNCFFLRPSSPFSASYFLLYLKSRSVLIFPSAKKITFPPRPPSPPSGPPSGTKGSLRNDTQPFPPFPDLMVIFALSTNIFFPFYLYFVFCTSLYIYEKTPMQYA